MNLSVFETYEREYQSLSQEIKEKINSVQTPSTTADSKILYCNQIKRELEEADEIVCKYINIAVIDRANGSGANEPSSIPEK